jgi:hypothetical protein
MLHLFSPPRAAGFLAGQQEFSAANPWLSARRMDGVTHFPALEIQGRDSGRDRAFRWVSQIGGQVVVGPGCTAPPGSILALRQPRVAVEEVPPGPLRQEIAPVFLDVVITVVGKNLSH